MGAVKKASTALADLRRQNDELKASSTSKDEFIALASHQLRTPATAVKQYLGMLLEGYVGTLTPAQREFVQKAYSSNERQLNTINDMLHIAQLDANKIVLKREICDLALLVGVVLQDNAANFKQRRQKVVIKHSGETLRVLADQRRLRMALENIIDNASKYSHPETQIIVHLSVVGSEALIQVTDQGVGIDHTDFARLFQKFSRIDNSLSIAVGGNGLGLYLAKRIIDAHKGVIELSSAVNQGTTFTIALPITREV